MSPAFVCPCDDSCAVFIIHCMRITNHVLLQKWHCRVQTVQPKLSIKSTVKLTSFTRETLPLNRSHSHSHEPETMETVGPLESMSRSQPSSQIRCSARSPQRHRRTTSRISTSLGTLQLREFFETGIQTVLSVPAEQRRDSHAGDGNGMSALRVATRCWYARSTRCHTNQHQMKPCRRYSLNCGHCTEDTRKRHVMHACMYVCMYVCMYG